MQFLAPSASKVLTRTQFSDKYYANNLEEGGKQAAMDLKAKVQEYLQSVEPDLGHLPVIIKAFANGDGLARLLVRAGIIKNDTGLSLFTSGFSQADDLFDFVLVGKGKDRADQKITGEIILPSSSPIVI